MPGITTRSTSRPGSFSSCGTSRHISARRCPIGARGIRFKEARPSGQIGRDESTPPRPNRFRRVRADSNFAGETRLGAISCSHQRSKWPCAGQWPSSARGGRLDVESIAWRGAAKGEAPVMKTKDKIAVMRLGIHRFEEIRRQSSSPRTSRIAMSLSPMRYPSHTRSHPLFWLGSRQYAGDSTAKIVTP